MDLITVCNTAIGRCGVSRYIQSLTERSNEAIACQVFIDSCIKRVLAAFPWNFATRYMVLQDIGTPPPTWAYRYRYPNDCVKARALTDSTFTFDTTNLPYYILEEIIRTGQCNRIPFTVVSDTGSQAIIANLQYAGLWYTGLVTDTNMWTEDAASALAWLLCSEIAPALSSKPDFAKVAGDAYALAIREAGALSLGEGMEREQPESEFVKVRW